MEQGGAIEGWVVGNSFRDQSESLRVAESDAFKSSPISCINDVEQKCDVIHHVVAD